MSNHAARGARLDERVRVLVADDYAPMRLGLRALLDEGGFDVCADAADASGAVAAALRERPDVCLLDIKMPGDGIAAAARITAALPETAVVMLTGSHDEADFLEAMRAGACAYVLKDADPERLPLVLRGVLAGETALPRTLVRHLLDRVDARDRVARIVAERGAELTARERQVVDLLAEGLTTREIAARLFVAPVTVRSHVAALLRKLGVADRAAALALLREHADRDALMNFNADA